MKLAVATANKRYLYEPCLKRLNIYDYFELIADVDTVGEGKNSVKLYNYVTDKLNEKPCNVAVFEDIHIGLKTAFENGYMAIAVYDHHYKDEELKRKYSHIYINNFKEIIEKSGLTVTIRRTLGSDINASCGQLRREKIKEDNKV